MPVPVTLEQFDGLRLGKASAALRQLDTEPPEPVAEPMDSVSIQPSPEQLKLAEEHQALKASQAQLASIVQSVKAELCTARQSVITESTDTLAKAAEALLPSLLDNGFAHELAEATLQIARVIEPEQITLKVHPDDHDITVEALRVRDSPDPVIVERDPGLTPGLVRLAWSQGGAEIDRAQLLQHAADLIAARLASLEDGKD